MRVFTVPSGSSMTSAISRCVRPPRSTSSSVRRCASGKRSQRVFDAQFQRNRIAVIAVSQRRPRVVAWQQFSITRTRLVLRTAEHVNRPVSRDPDEPRLHAPALRIEARRPVPAPQEDVLHHLLGDIAVPHDAERHREDESPIPLVERSQRILAAARHGREQQGVVRRRFRPHVVCPQRDRMQPAGRRRACHGGGAIGGHQACIRSGWPHRIEA